MRPSLKLALIGSEVTILAAFTGVGIHLAMQPHRTAFRPPPITLPLVRPPALPTLITPLVPAPSSSSSTAPSPKSIGPDLLRSFGQQDRNLLVEQWDTLQRLTGAMERYIEARVLEQFEKKR